MDSYQMLPVRFRRLFWGVLLLAAPIFFLGATGDASGQTASSVRMSDLQTASPPAFAAQPRRTPSGSGAGPIASLQSPQPVDTAALAAATGEITFIGKDSQGNFTIERIRPDGTHQQRVWTHPGTSGTQRLMDLAWKPDASEIAFASDHEFGHSAFQVDVYSIRPNGSGLRRVTNAPGDTAINGGGYSFGTVQMQIYNGYGTVAPFLVYVEGAKQAVAHDPGNFQDTTGITIPNVADLGTEPQYIAFVWSSTNCSTGIEVAAIPVDVQAGKTVSVGPVTFQGSCATPWANRVTWKRDGSKIGFHLSSAGPQQVDAAGGNVGAFSSLFTLTSPNTIYNDLDWSPVNDDILFHGSVNSNWGFYLSSVGSSNIVSLVVNFSTSEAAWLPDGSTFVYGMGHLYEYIPNGADVVLVAVGNGESVRHPSVSPDGRFVVFEREVTSNDTHDLWIYDSQNATVSPLATSNSWASSPDWSRADPPVYTYLYLPLIVGP